MPAHLSLTNNDTAYYTTAGLAAAAGVSCTKLSTDVKSDIGEVSKARVILPRLGARWDVSRCRTYIELCHENAQWRAKAEQWANAREAREATRTPCDSGSRTPGTFMPPP